MIQWILGEGISTLMILIRILFIFRKCLREVQAVAL
jgi:hypothetical protein